MISTRSLALGVILLCTLPAVVGCGYQTTSLYRSDISSVAVPVFTNKTSTLGPESAVTRAVIQQIQSRTPYKIAEQSSADSVLIGEITELSTRPLSSDRLTNLPKEVRTTLSVDFTWKDLRSGAILRQRRSFTASSVNYPTLGESQEISTQSTIDQLATQIVDELQADW